MDTSSFTGVLLAQGSARSIPQYNDIVLLYRGWSVVIDCGIIASFSWGLGFYGLGVYLHAFGTVFGLVAAAAQAGVALGPGLMGLLHDALGSYQPVLWCLVGLESLAVAAVLAGKALRR